MYLQSACAMYYFFCTWISESFIINFVVTTVLIVTEFWFTKNIGGRRLTGMRWWQVPSSTGSESTWRFEHRALEQVRPLSTRSCAFEATEQVAKSPLRMQPNFQASKIAITQFWVGMIGLEIFWVIMAVFAVRSPGYLILCVMAFSFTALNLFGYYKCRSWSSQQLKQTVPDFNIVPGLPSSAASALFQARLLQHQLPLCQWLYDSLLVCVLHISTRTSNRGVITETFWCVQNALGRV